MKTVIIESLQISSQREFFSLSDYLALLKFVEHKYWMKFIKVCLNFLSVTAGLKKCDIDKKEKAL